MEQEETQQLTWLRYWVFVQHARKDSPSRRRKRK